MTVSQLITVFFTAHEGGLRALYTRNIRLQEPLSNVSHSDFEVLRPLGQGSFGKVYLVRKKTCSRLFAMKVLSKERVLTKKLTKYAMTERNILVHVKHPFIVTLSYAFQTTHKLVFVLEFCPGGDLGHHLSQHKTLPEWLSKIYICEVLLAIEELHRNNTILRDLKPENILLDGQGHTKLVDFGLSKDAVNDEVPAQSFCGSLAYLPPEILQRRGHGKAVDWYLLGVVFFELLFGTPPYYSTDRNKLFNDIQQAQLLFPRELSVGLRELITQLLHRDPAQRLGAGGAAEVKQHQYFAGVNWGQVLRKELKPVTPELTTQFTGNVPLTEVYGSFTERPNARVAGWTFISK